MSIFNRYPKKYTYNIVFAVGAQSKEYVILAVSNKEVFKNDILDTESISDYFDDNELKPGVYKAEMVVIYSECNHPLDPTEVDMEIHFDNIETLIDNKQIKTFNKKCKKK